MKKFYGLAALIYCSLGSIAYCAEWRKSEGKIVLISTNNIEQKTLTLENKRDNVMTKNGGNKLRIVETRGEVVASGKYVWVERQESLENTYGRHEFKYYDSDGSLLFEKPNFVNFKITNDGDTIFAIEINTQAIASLDSEGWSRYPMVYDIHGNPLAQFVSCNTPAYEWLLTENQKYAVITCISESKANSQYQYVYDVVNKKTHRWNGPGLVKVFDDGSYQSIRTWYEKNSKTGEIEKKTEVVKKGKF